MLPSYFASQSGLLAIVLVACSASDPASVEAPAGAGNAGVGGIGGASHSGMAGDAGALAVGGHPTNAGSAGSAGTDSASSSGTGGLGQPPAKFTLRVMALNAWDEPASVVAEDILNAKADVVGLQEVTPSNLEEITSALGSGWSFVQEDRNNTHGIVSKHPIVERIGVTDDHRGGLGATIQLDKDVRIHLFSTHLMYTPYGPYQLAKDKMSVADVVESDRRVRMPALQELLNMAEPQIASDDATFLVGDFNAPSHLDYAPSMPWPTSLAAEQAGLVDSYAELHPDNPKKWAGEFRSDDPGITWTQIPASEPYNCFDRIDFVHYSARDARALESATINVASSDHRAVLTSFEVSEPARTDKPRNALPKPSRTNVARRPLLSWTRGRDSALERVYLGTNSTDTLVAELDGSHLVPALLAPNTNYVWRVDTVTRSGVVTGDTWSFTTLSSGGLSPDKVLYAPGDAILIDFDGADATHDWIGLYARTAAYGEGNPALTWKYLNDTTTAPANVVAQGRVTLNAPLETGTYVLRFFEDNGYAVEDELAIQVQ